MYSESLQSKIRRYFKCPEDTEFVCCNCSRNLCIPCKEKHADDIDTKDRSVVVYREIFKCFSKQEMCVRHLKCFMLSIAKRVKFPSAMCARITKKHEVIDIRIAYKAKRELHLEPIHIIRS